MDLAQRAASEFEASAELLDDLFPIALADVHKRDNPRRLIAEAAKGILSPLRRSAPRGRVLARLFALMRSNEATMKPADIGSQTPIWEVAYTTHHDQWVRLAARWVGELKAEGLVEELLTRWWEDGRTFATPADLNRLMRAAIPNRALDWLVGRQRHVPAPPEELAAAAQPGAPASSSPDAHSQAEQIIEAVWPVVLATLDSCSHSQAQAFVLRVGRRLQPRKIAKLQHTTANTVGVRIIRVARRLSNRLAAAFPDGLAGLDDEVRRQIFSEISVRMASLDRYIQ